MISQTLKDTMNAFVELAKGENVNATVLMSEYKEDGADFASRCAIKKNGSMRYSHICLDQIRELMIVQNLDTQGDKRARDNVTAECLLELADQLVFWHNMLQREKFGRLEIDPETGVLVLENTKTTEAAPA